jgi:hypothetical protein
MYGLTVEEASGAPVDVWPDNLAAVNVFISMSTQWNVGMGGPTGLNYVALPFALDMAGVSAADRAEVFSDIRIMEDAALEKMRDDK